MSLARSPIEFPELIREGDHLVQFYRHDSHLADVVSNFAAPALMNNEGVIIIATKEHLDRFERNLQGHYLNTSFMKLTKQLVLLDAHEMLGQFMQYGLPDSGKFMSTVGQLIKDMKGQYPSIKAYGEMVNVLWGTGNLEGTLELERLWNELQKDFGFSLLCAYSLESLSEEKNGLAFSEICQCHSHVIPAEGIMEIDNHKEQLKKIAELQFKMSSSSKSFTEWKVNSLEMMIPLTALKIYLKEMKNKSDFDLKSLVLKCEHQIDRMTMITEKLSKN